MRSVYLNYLSCLNERRWADLGDFVADSLTYNGEITSRGEYRAMLERDVAAIPDLRYVPELLVVDGDVVACRLFFRCTPQRAFVGFEPTGAQIAFAEHVFYRFRDARIVDVHSVIDEAAIRAQVL